MKKKNGGMGSGSRTGLPDNVIMKDYPKVNYAEDVDLPDTIVNIDKEIDETVSKMKRHKSKKRF